MKQVESLFKDNKNKMDSIWDREFSYEVSKYLYYILHVTVKRHKLTVSSHAVGYKGCESFEFSESLRSSGRASLCSAELQGRPSHHNDSEEQLCWWLY